MGLSHANNGACPMCLAIINRYPGFNENLKSWFFKMQMRFKEFHISCAGRGYQDQEAVRIRGASRARYGESAHNYGAALDSFVILPGEKSIYPTAWYNNILATNIPDWISWYGARGSQFFELPHLEIKEWRDMVKQGYLKLVE